MMKNISRLIFTAIFIISGSCFSQSVISFNHWGGLNDAGSISVNDFAVDANNNCYLAANVFNDYVINGTTYTSPSCGGFIIYKVAANGNTQWILSSSSYQGCSGGNVSTIASDDSANLYIAGRFDTKIILDSDTIVAANNSGKEFFLAKIDSSGDLKWFKNFHTLAGEMRDIAVAKDGAITITGSFYDSLYFPVVLNSVNNTNLDVFIAHFDRNGNFLWAMKGEGTTSLEDEGKALTTDAGGNIYATGKFRYGINFGALTFTNNVSFASSYILKINPAGTILQSTYYCSGDLNSPQDIAIDNSGNIYTTGFGHNLVTSNAVTTPPEGVSYILKFNNNLVPQWAQSVKSNFGASNVLYDLNLGIKNNLIAFWGGFSNKIWFAGNDTLYCAGRNDCLYAVYDSNGNLQEKYQIGQPHFDNSIAMQITFNGETIVCGTITDSLMTTPVGFGLNSANTVYYTNLPGGNSFLARLNSIVGLENQEEESPEVNIYPNPVSDLLNINLKNPNKEEKTIVIYDINGRMTSSFQMNDNDLSIDVSEYAAGIYFAVIRSLSAESKIKTFKFIVAHKKAKS